MQHYWLRGEGGLGCGHWVWDTKFPEAQDDGLGVSQVGRKPMRERLVAIPHGMVPIRRASSRQKDFHCSLERLALTKWRWTDTSVMV